MGEASQLRATQEADHPIEGIHGSDSKPIGSNKNTLFDLLVGKAKPYIGGRSKPLPSGDPPWTTSIPSRARAPWSSAARAVSALPLPGDLPPAALRLP